MVMYKEKKFTAKFITFKDWMWQLIVVKLETNFFLCIASEIWKRPWIKYSKFYSRVTPYNTFI